MNVLLTNTLQTFHVHLHEFTPRLTNYNIVTVNCKNTRNDKHMSSKGVKYCQKQ